MATFPKKLFSRFGNPCKIQIRWFSGEKTAENGLPFPFHRITGKNPGVVYCTGLGTPPWDSEFPLRLQKHVADQRGHGFFRFQYRFVEDQNRIWHIANWVEDIISVFKFLDETEGPEKRIVIGASAGAQAVVRAVIQIPNKVHSLMLLSPGLALDMGYMERIYPGSFQKLKDGETMLHPTVPGGFPASVNYECLQHEYGDQDPINTYKYPDPIPIECPVRILHGMDDFLVPYKNSLKYAKRLAAEDVEVNILKAKGHLLESCPQVFTALDKLLENQAETQKKGTKKGQEVEKPLEESKVTKED